MSRKADPAEVETDKIIAEIEKRIRAEYEQAQREINDKLDDYFRRYYIKEETWRKWVRNGVKTKEEFREWRKGQMIVGERWEAMRDTISQDLLNANKIARSIAAEYRPEVYATNHNYATYQVERDANVDTSYTLYSRESVTRLFRENPQILPAPGKKVSQDIADGIAKRWNNQHIQSVALQAILQGNSIPDIATRLSNAVCDTNRKAATRNARTMMTGVQNAGRIDAYQRAADMGVKCQKEWLAILDGRTRHAHRQLDRQTVPLNKPFKNEYGEILYPGDPTAAAANVYNCRCTLASKVEGLESEVDKRINRANIEGQTYEEWKADRKARSNPILNQEKISDNTRAGFIREYRGTGGYVRSGRDMTLNVDAARRERNILDELRNTKISSIPVTRYEHQPTEQEIINRVGGGDMTRGSCASLALCYAGNKAGYDCRDFRGGDSTLFFARTSTWESLFNMDGVDSSYMYSNMPRNQMMNIANTVVEAGKEYIITAGSHSAVIRRNGNELQYLELQSPTANINGWRTFDDWALTNRFNCSITAPSKELVGILETNSLTSNKDFPDILSYINTLEPDQQKGASGSMK